MRMYWKTSRGKAVAAAALLIAVALFAANCAGAKKPVKKTFKGAKMNWTIKSDSISENKRIPDKFTCKGTDISPALSWDAAPKGAQELVLIMDDPDAPVGTWTHWIVYGISPDRTSLPENVEKSAAAASVGALQGVTSFRRPGYGGPCPPPGPAHRYFFKLFALDKKTGLPAGASLAQVEAAIKGHVIAEAKLMGTFSR